MGSFITGLTNTRGFKYLLFGLKALIENYVETGTQKHPSKVDIGPINTVISKNFIDGIRTRISAQTTANMSPHLFLVWILRTRMGKQEELLQGTG